MTTPGDTLATLLQQAIATANKLIPLRNPIIPFVITLAEDGSGHMHTGSPEENESVIVEALYNNLQEEAKNGTVIAFALVLEVSVTNNETGNAQDAIRINMEHAEHPDGESCAIPFARSGDKIQWGKVARLPPEPKVWSSTEDT